MRATSCCTTGEEQRTCLVNQHQPLSHRHVLNMLVGWVVACLDRYASKAHVGSRLCCEVMRYTIALSANRYQLVYAVGDVTVLPSRDERVAVVQALLQALNQLVLAAAEDSGSCPELTAPGVARWSATGNNRYICSEITIPLLLCCSHA
jgi:hypothetical protein